MSAVGTGACLNQLLLYACLSDANERGRDLSWSFLNN
ncbi:uncharacterized protein FFFS_04289 [Fusarium fujikuroi]|nr:uncharacterized protein FFFS_04289 [Fusarium fujikuroi]